MTQIIDTAAVERGQLYALLATVFRRPLDAAQLEWLRSPAMLAAMASAGADPGSDFAEGEAKLILHRLAIDYTQLFHTPADRIAPYEGMQTGAADHLMGEAAHAVRSFLADVGYVVLPEGGELPDHISVELAFMSELARHEAEAMEAGDDATIERAVALQRQFLSQHLGRWAEAFAGKVEQAADTRFYSAMAGLLAGFIADELCQEPT
jgi:TorA maturation chaperone TorD